MDADWGLLAPYYGLSCQKALFVSCDDGDGDEAGREPVFLLLVDGGVGRDRQIDRSEMLPMVYDLTLGE
eukprot:COSAG02_NODE_5614_length_4181_cov_11.419157_3_plen_69_part_00